jgi:hypothetical protein
MSVQKRQADRFRFLNRLYDITGGDKLKWPSYQQIGEDIGVSQDEAFTLADYLAGKNLIRWMIQGGGIAITENGVDEVERALTHPTQPTTYFPPVNVLNVNIGTMTNSQIQQGTVGSSQTILTGSERAEIEGVLAQVQRIIATLPPSSQERIDVEANVGAVRLQLGTSKPSRSVIREAFVAIRETLQFVADASVVLEAVGKLITVLGAV